MNMYDVSNYIDELRVDKGIKTSDFIEGICSNRTYLRYRNNVTEMNLVTVLAFLNKLGLEFTVFNQMYKTYLQKKYKYEEDLYHAIVSADYDVAYDIYLKNDCETFHTSVAFELKILVEVLLYEKDQISLNEAGHKISDLLKVDDLLKRTYIPSYILHTIIIANNMLLKSDKAKLLKLFDLIIKGDIVVLSNNYQRTWLSIITGYFKLLVTYYEDDALKLKEPFIKALNTLHEHKLLHYSFNIIKEIYELEYGYQHVTYLKEIVDDFLIASFGLNKAFYSIWDILEKERLEQSSISNLDQQTSLVERMAD